MSSPPDLAGAGGFDDADESVAQLSLQSLESGVTHHGVAGEA